MGNAHPAILDRADFTQLYDSHATILHVMGIGHARLTVRHVGIDRRLTDVHGHVIQEILVKSPRCRVANNPARPRDLPMSSMTDSDALVPFIRVCQIIVGALVMGVVTFLVIVVVFLPRFDGGGPDAAQAGRADAPQAAPATELPIITDVALAMGASVLVLSFVIPQVAVTQARGQIAKGTAPKPAKTAEEDTASLLPIYQTQLIIGAALLEGGAFFATIAYMLERKPMALAAAGVLLGVLLTRLPTALRLRGWLDRQTEILLEERQTLA